MMAIKVCRKCDKQYPSNVLFCPDCGSLTLKPEAPEAEPRPKAVAVKRANKLAPAPSLPSRPLPPAPRVRTEHTREDLFRALADNKVPEEDVDVVRRLMEWSEGLASSVSFGDNVADGGRVGFRPSVRVGDKDVSLFCISTDGRIDISFKDWMDLPPFDSREKRVEMLGRLNAIKGVKIPELKIIDRPPVPVRALRDKESFDMFVEAYHWFVAQVKGQ